MIETLGKLIEQNIVEIALVSLLTGIWIWTLADRHHRKMQKRDALFDEVNRSIDEEDLGV